MSIIVAGSDRAFFNPGETVYEKEDDRMALYIVQEGLLEACP